MKRPKVSLIIPIFNSENYICRCVDSALVQTLKEIEIILINDGSSDNSGKICDRYQIIDSRIKVIHKSNNGPSSARNAGLSAADGEYIGFIDSDDYIDPQFCEEMVDVAEKFGLDIVNCDCYREGHSRELLPSKFPKSIVIESRQIQKYLEKAHELKITWFTCRNLYKTRLLAEHGILFDERLKLGEDSVFNFQAFYNAKKIYSINKALYYYCCNPDSLSQKSYRPDLLENLAAQYETKQKFYQTTELNYQQDFYRNNIEHCLVMLLMNVYNNSVNHINTNELRKIRNAPFINNSFKHYQPSNKLSPNMRLLISLFKNHMYYLGGLLIKIRKFK